MGPGAAWIEATRAENRARLGLAGVGQAPTTSPGWGALIVVVAVGALIVPEVLEQFGTRKRRKRRRR